MVYFSALINQIITVCSFGSGGFTTATAVNQTNGNLGKFHLCSLWYDIFNYPNPTKWISKLEFWNLIIQTGKKIQFIKLDISNWRIRKIHCFQVNDCSNKMLVIKGGSHFLSHCWKMTFVTKSWWHFFLVQKCWPPFST